MFEADFDETEELEDEEEHDELDAATVVPVEEDDELDEKELDEVAALDAACSTEDFIVCCPSGKIELVVTIASLVFFTASFSCVVS